MRVLTCDADPQALRRGLRELVLTGEGRARRTWAVVGPLPGAGRDELLELGRHAVRLDVQRLVVVGDAGAMHAGAVLEGSWGEESRHVPDATAAVAALEAEVSEDDVVLVCGCPDALVRLSRPEGGAA
jgi:UDP-N-acetylmuramoyl-tripeptide--D-alanyl-D-alanine ligase